MNKEIRTVSSDGSLIERMIDLALTPAGDLPQAARALATLSLMDWLVCARAGADEPVGEILRAMIAHEGGVPEASVTGGAPAPARAAALVNGTIGHAIDYDDTHFAHIGHPSAAIYPAALAVAEMEDLSAEAVCTAFLVGAEASIRIGCVLGREHYNRGFHQTATAGAFGATLAAARLLRLTRGQVRAAIGLCASRAAGLRCQFGTMGKPYNAGIAAASGVECALLARAGLTSADDGLMGPQGFVMTHSNQPDPDAANAEGFLFEAISHKLHACCHGTHAMIEVLRNVERGDPDQVAAVTVRTSPRWLSVCNIPVPRTGLEVKFSYPWLAAMVLHDRSTQDDRAFTDALARDAELGRTAALVEVRGDGSLTETQAAVEIVTVDGRRIAGAHDLAGRPPLPDLRASLVAKARASLGQEAERIIGSIDMIDELSAREIGALLVLQPRVARAG